MMLPTDTLRVSPPPLSPDWRDLQLFLLVARCGGLRPAARLAGVSATTARRRVAALERYLGYPLFERLASGYALNRHGSEVLLQVERMASAIQNIERRQDDSLPVVHLASDAWLGRYLGARRASLCQPDDGFRLEPVSGRPPSSGDRPLIQLELRQTQSHAAPAAGQRLIPVDFAVYAASSTSTIDGSAGGAFAERSGPSRSAGTASVRPAIPSSVRPSAECWVTLQNLSAEVACWIEAQPGRIVARVSDVPLLMPLLRAGVGRTVLPCFIGDTEPGLTRMGTPIGALRHELWVRSQAGAADLPVLSCITARLVALLTGHTARFAGNPAIS